MLQCRKLMRRQSKGGDIGKSGGHSRLSRASYNFHSLNSILPNTRKKELVELTECAANGFPQSQLNSYFLQLQRCRRDKSNGTCHCPPSSSPPHSLPPKSVNILRQITTTISFRSTSRSNLLATRHSLSQVPSSWLLAMNQKRAQSCWSTSWNTVSAMIAGYKLNSKSRSGEGKWKLSQNCSFDPSSVSYMHGIFYDLANEKQLPKTCYV
jgi:hypothetical protein